MIVETSGRKLKIPLERVARLQFAQRKRPMDDPESGLTRLELIDGSRITMKITGMNEQILTGDIPGGARHTLPVAFVRALTFETDIGGK